MRTDRLAVLVAIGLVLSVVLVFVLVASPGTAFANDDLDGDGIPNADDPETSVSSDLTLPAGEYTLRVLTVTNNSILTLGSDPSLEGFKGVTIHADNLTVEAGSSISSDGKGYGSDAGPGKGSGALSNGSGAGYGGTGGYYGSAAGGLTYGSLTMPVDPGSGGGHGWYSNGGPGGGAILLNVLGTLTVGGAISANGDDGVGRNPWSDWCGSGGGSGGSIYITASTIAGSGTIAANGGAGGYASGGGGGGGRIAIYYATNSCTGAISAYGGASGGSASSQGGGAGTIFTKSSVQSHGDLLLDNNNKAGATTPLSGTLDFDNVVIRNQANVTLPSGGNITAAVLSPIQSASLTLETGSVLNVPSIALQSASLTIQSGVTFAPTDISIQSSTVTNNGNLSWTSIDFQGGTMTNNGTISAPSLTLSNINLKNNGILNIPDNSITIGSAGILELNTPISLTNLIIQSGGILSHEAGQKLDLTVTNNLTIEPGGSINVAGKGYGHGSGPGAGGSGSSYSGGGAGYGGVGGSASASSGGTTYGSLTMPTDLGSGGGDETFYSVWGGSGGGAIILDVLGTLTVGGVISANGNDGVGRDCWNTWYGGGGGSGGSIYVTASTIAGNGTIAANGGAGGYRSAAGGGGGGRIAIYYATNSYTGAISAYGGAPGASGSQYGGPGTVFTSQPPTQPPTQPSNIMPANGATEVSLTPTLQSSAFSDPDVGDTHAASQWQVTTTPGDYSTPVLGLTSNIRLTSYPLPSGILEYSTAYYWHVRHQDNLGAWSDWSAETSFTAMSSSGDNTPTGSPVTVLVNGATVTFDNVAVAGNTGITTQQGNPGGGIPEGFRVHGQFTDVITTATYTGPITICLPYDPSTLNPQNLKLFHWQGGHWMDVTTGVDTVNHRVCGEVSSLSWFFIGGEWVWVDDGGGGSRGVPVFPSIYIGIGAALGAGIMAYFVRRRLAS